MSDDSTTPKRKKRGPAADPTVRTRVLEAFIAQVAEKGLGNASIDDIAAAANVSKVTLYKRWPTRRELVMDGFALVLAGPVPMPDAKSAREMFDRLFARVVDDDTYRRMRQITAEMVAASGYDEEVRAIMQERDRNWRRWIREMIEFGKRTGEVPANRDTETAAEVLFGVTHRGYVLPDRPIVPDLAEFVWALLTDDRPY